MKPRKLVLAPQASEDLTAIFVYIAQKEDIVTATTFLADLNAKIEWIAKSGFSGASREWIRPDLRAFPYRNRCIYFRIDGDTVNVLRVIHGRQDVDSKEF